MNSNRSTANPLSGFMRQPKIYIKLPSNGIYWDKGSIVMPENGELAVYSMTAKDELAFKTPDALLNGQAVVDVIQSCIPSIKNAWNVPSIDLDVILIGIRIATYGEILEVSHKVPNTELEASFHLNLTSLLDNIYSQPGWNETVHLNDDLVCFVKPLTYKHITQTSLKTFESRKIMQTVNDEKISDEEKLKIFNDSFKKLSDITVILAAESVKAIQTPDTVVENQEFIKDFLKNADKDIFQKIQNHIAKLKNDLGIKPLRIETTQEQREAGAPEFYDLPISFDNSNFFGNGS